MIAPGEVALLYLAAGLSRRFGAADKLMADMDGAPLGLYAARMLGRFSFARKIAVCAPGSALAAALEREGFAIVRNPEPARGMGSSLHCGYDAGREGRHRAWLIALADMPFVPEAHVAAMLAGFNGDRLASCTGALRCPPVLIGRIHDGALARMKGDSGARELIADAPCAAAPEAWLRDIDTPDALPPRL